MVHNYPTGKRSNVKERLGKLKKNNQMARTSTLQ